MTDADIAERAALLTTALSGEDQVFLINAIDELVAQCMVGKGWDYQAPTATVEDLLRGSARTEVWLFDDIEAARANGYGIVSAASSAESVSPRDAPIDLSQMTQAQIDQFDLALFGSDAERVEIQTDDGGTTSLPGGGCLGEGRTAVYGDLAEYLRIRQLRTSVVGDVWSQTLSSRPVASALRSWRECMADAGYDYEDPDAVVESVFAEIASVGRTRALEHEIGVAEADAVCKAETELAEAFGASFVDSTDGVLAEHESALLGARDFESDAIERAKAALSG